MKQMITLLAVYCLLLFAACTSTTMTTGTKVTAEAAEAIEEVTISTDAGKQLTVKVRDENVRQVPNGKVLGKLRNGDAIRVVKRVGNWIQFTNNQYKNAYIWAPSVGYTYENLYSPFFYYDTTQKVFHDINFFETMFSQKGQRRQETNTSYELFFKNLGLGSHESTVLEVVTESQQVVEHGITLFIHKTTETVEKVRVDYFQAIQGYENALKKSELPIKEPTTENSGHLIWKAGENGLLSYLIVDLERKEWDSRLFSSIWYILPEKKEK
jgi:hypothetical protein